MSSSADRELKKEILYLKKLIHAHKKSTRPQTPKSSRTFVKHHGSHSKQATKRKIHGNLVYKPQESNHHSGSGAESLANAPGRLGNSQAANGTARSVLKKPGPMKRHQNLVYRPNNSTSVLTTSSTISAASTNGLTAPPSTEAARGVEVTKTSNEVKLKGVEATKMSNEVNPRGEATKRNTKVGVEATKTNTGVRSKFKWKRRSISDDQQPNVHSSKPNEVRKMTPRRELRTNSRYKWRRRSSSGSKESAVPVSPLIAQSKFKLTRASLIWRQSSSPFTRRGGSFRQRRLSYRKKHTPLSQRFKSPLRRKTHTRKSKNKVWIAGGERSSSSPGPSNPNTPVGAQMMVGREVKTSRGNKQWVASSLTGQATKQGKSGLVSLRGDKFVQDKSGKKLKRLSSSSRFVEAVKRRNSSLSGVVRTPSVKQFLASRAVRKSKLYVWNAKHRDKSKQYCMFFNRFGKCNHQDTCPYIHDPDKIAVCRKFLRGVCKKTDGSCPFSHKISKEKMPVCSFFLHGVCTKDQCPYLHVSVGREAKICMDFARGYCPKGEECTMQHVLDCPEYLEKCACPRGKSCPLRHRERLYKIRQEKAESQSKAGPVSAVKEPYAFKMARRQITKRSDFLSLEPSSPTLTDTPTGTTSTPLDMSKAPDFIAL